MSSVLFVSAPGAGKSRVTRGDKNHSLPTFNVILRVKMNLRVLWDFCKINDIDMTVRRLKDHCIVSQLRSLWLVNVWKNPEI